MKSQHVKRQKQRTAFTLVEMLTVIAIITILAALILSGLNAARRRGREIQCMNNMRNLALAAQMYRDDHREHIIKDPPWLSTLYGRSEMQSKGPYVCPFDTQNGLASPRLKYEELNPSSSSTFYREVADNMNNTEAAAAPYLTQRNVEVQGCSYFYEFAAPWYRGNSACPSGFADTDGDGSCSWGEVKIQTMEKGDCFTCSPPCNPPAVTGCASGTPSSYTVGDFAMIRCHWHMKSADGGRREIMNVAYDSRAYKSGISWQKTIASD